MPASAASAACCAESDCVRVCGCGCVFFLVFFPEFFFSARKRQESGEDTGCEHHAGEKCEEHSKRGLKLLVYEASS